MVCYDPDGATREALRRLGVEVRALPGLSAASLVDGDLLVVGAGAIDESSASVAGEIQAFVQGGARVLCLEQTDMPRWLPVPIRMCSEVGTPAETISFAVSDSHPVTRGFRPESLRFWRDDHLVCARSLVEPDQGNFLPLADSGLDLEHCPLPELPEGCGVYLVCQLLVAGRFGREPMARGLLRNMLSYLDTYRSGPLGGAVVGGAGDTRFSQALQTELKLDTRSLQAGTGSPGGSRCLVVEGAALAGTPAAAVAAWLAAGRTVLVHGLAPRHVDDFERVTATKLDLAPAGEPEPLRLRSGEPETRGMRHFDLAWQRPGGLGLSPNRLAWRALVRGEHSPAELCEQRGVLVRVPKGGGVSWSISCCGRIRPTTRRGPGASHRCC